MLAPVPAEIASTHFGNFLLGQSGVYQVTVSNGAAPAVPSISLVTVSENLPSGLTLVSMSGTGWSCSSNICTRSDSLNPGSSYPVITVTVNVNSNAPSPVTNQVSLSGGGSTGASANDVTTVSAFSPCDIKQSGSINLADVQLLINQASGRIPAVNALAGNGAVSVVDVELEISVALGFGCGAK